jgi:hypothetical protein
MAWLKKNKMLVIELHVLRVHRGKLFEPEFVVKVAF